MLFLTYWELNEDLPSEQMLAVAQKLSSHEMMPPKGVKAVRWDVTPDRWGILLAEAESVADITRAINVWRAAAPGFFKFTRTAPAQPIQEYMSQGSELLKTLSRS